MRTQVQRAINAAEAKDVAIGAAGAQTLSGLTSLTKLNLSNEELGDEGVQALSELPALRLLNLDRNEFGPLGMKALSRLTLLTSLDIGRNSIRGEGALALADLEKLTWLCIAENRISSEGAKALANLNRLTSLDLQNNNIGPECAPALSGLTALTSLNLAGNRIGTFGIKAFSELTNLRFLNLKGNGIGPIGAGAPGSLTSLTVLLLQEDNPIGDEGVRALANLKALTELDLDGSEITDLRPLVGLPELEVFALTGCHLSKPSPQFWLKPSLRKINISDVSIPGVPEEILNGMAGPIQAALLAHFRDQERGGSTPLLEIKLMLLGNGRVGKTQIRNRLCDQDFEAKSDSTHGVNLAVVPLAPHSETATFSSGTSFADVDESSFKLKIWDFGGQEIYLGTHALFLRSRAIFSVVWAEGMNDGNHLYADIESQNFPLEYWVHYVASMGGLSSPLLIIRTRADEHTRDPRSSPKCAG